MIDSHQTTASHASDEAGARYAVITGASSGIGAAVALRLARRGYRTILLARRNALLDPLAAELSRHAPSTVIAVDLADAEAVDRAAAAAIQAADGRLHVLVNAAGAGAYCRFLEHDEAAHRRLMQVNYFAPALIVRRLLPVMLRAGRGHVINIASMSTKCGPWGHGAYAAAKSALVSLTQSLAAEYTDRGMHFSYVNPGIVDTEYFQTPETVGLWNLVKHRAIGVDVVADAIVGLLDRPRLEICVPRHYRMLDWIRALSPSLAHRIVARGSRCAAEGDVAVEFREAKASGSPAIEQ